MISVKQKCTFEINLPVRNNGMDRKNPPIAHIRVDAAPFRYFEVLKISVEIYIIYIFTDSEWSHNFYYFIT